MKTSKIYTVCEIQSDLKKEAFQTILSQLSDDTKGVVDEVSGKYSTSLLLACLSSRCLKWKAGSFYVIIKSF